MRRFVVAFAAIVGLCVVYAIAHWALIETGNEVIVLRTEEADGGWLETRLWIVDDGGVSWLHGDGESRWMRNLKARPIVEITRSEETRRYRATPVPGPHPRLHELLRAKYGVADRWVRFVGRDKESTTPVRLEMFSAP
jgi:F420H(2)-dependent quinone reductase